MNFEAVERQSPAAADVLRAAAFLSADEIPFELLTEGAAHLGAPIQDALVGVREEPALLAELLRPLARYSLIAIADADRTFCTHRMVQAVMNDWLGAELQKLWAERVVRALDAVSQDVEFSNWNRCRRLVPHWQVADRHIQAFDLYFDAASRLLNQAGYFLSEQAQFKEAEPLYRRALAIDEQSYGPEEPNVAILLNNLSPTSVASVLLR